MTWARARFYLRLAYGAPAVVSGRSPCPSAGAKNTQAAAILLPLARAPMVQISRRMSLLFAPPSASLPIAHVGGHRLSMAANGVWHEHGRLLFRLGPDSLVRLLVRSRA